MVTPPVCDVYRPQSRTDRIGYFDTNFGIVAIHGEARRFRTVACATRFGCYRTPSGVVQFRRIVGSLVSVDVTHDLNKVAAGTVATLAPDATASSGEATRLAIGGIGYPVSAQLLNTDGVTGEAAQIGCIIGFRAQPRSPLDFFASAGFQRFPHPRRRSAARWATTIRRHIPWCMRRFKPRLILDRVTHSAALGANVCAPRRSGVFGIAGWRFADHGGSNDD